MTSELSISKHVRTHTLKQSNTYDRLRPVDASERVDCSWLGSDQGVFPAFFEMDSDFFTFRLFNKTVRPLCAAKRMKAQHTTALFMSQNVILQLKSEK